MPIIDTRVYTTVDNLVSVLPNTLIDAYNKTRFEVRIAGGFSFHLNSYPRDLDRLMLWHGVRTVGTITAWNPHSQLVNELCNRKAQHRLERLLDHLGYIHLPAFGHDPDGVWPGEETRLVLGIDLPRLAALGRRFRQNAVTFYDRRSCARLVLLR